MYFAQNIKLLRKRKLRTQDDVAFSLKMKRSTLSGYENKIAEPGIEALISFSKYYNLSIDTLVKIDLSILSEFQLSELERGFDVYVKGTKIRVLSTTVNQDNEENIELVPEKAKAGYTAGFADPDYIRSLPVFHLPFLSKDKKYRTFQISGDSMLPVPDKSWVTCEFIIDWTNIKDFQPCIVVTIDEGIVFKLVENLITTEGIVRLHSLNKIYKPYEIPVSELKEMWRFVNFISSEIIENQVNTDKFVQTISKLQDDVEILKRKFAEIEA